jgi:hypothetical protein
MGTVTKPLVPFERTFDEDTPVPRGDRVKRPRQRSRVLPDSDEVMREDGRGLSAPPLVAIADNVPGVFFC